MIAIIVGDCVLSNTVFHVLRRYYLFKLFGITVLQLQSLFSDC